MLIRDVFEVGPVHGPHVRYMKIIQDIQTARGYCWHYSGLKKDRHDDGKLQYKVE